MKKYIEIDETGCHIWTGAKNQYGYGQILLDGKMVQVHRLAYEQHTGQKIPEGMCVLHVYCDNPPCCNPEHLKLGTHQDNMNDMVKKGRQARGENLPQTKLTDKQVIEIRNRTESQKKLAEEYGVSHTLIGQIKRREIWSHV